MQKAKDDAERQKIEQDIINKQKEIELMKQIETEKIAKERYQTMIA